jgi:hypothetical protein
MIAFQRLTHGTSRSPQARAGWLAGAARSIERVGVDALRIKQSRLTPALGDAKAGHRGESG